MGICPAGFGGSSRQGGVSANRGAAAARCLCAARSECGRAVPLPAPLPLAAAGGVGGIEDVRRGAATPATPCRARGGLLAGSGGCHTEGLDNDRGGRALGMGGKRAACSLREISKALL